MYDTASELYNDYLGIYFDDKNELSDAKRNKMELKCNPDDSFLETCNYDDLFVNGERNDTKRETNKEESDMPPLEGDEEEVK